ncbi:MAG TPA: hypothetical protein VIT91_00635 [Chthoniobacterales bacterium]
MASQKIPESRAESYRATVTNPVTGAEVAEKLTTESEALFTALPTGVALKLAVTAINGAGESQPGEPFTITLT